MTKQEMREPERIDRIINKLRDEWKKNPNRRFWQLIMNKNRYLYDEDMKVKDPFYIEDAEFERVLNNRLELWIKNKQ